ncbi:hypothetical protein BN77_2517 [Rhizobium mesoamericanum STM3625]|uniref:Transposase n=1 Tax=Rhizobium mesoamericanum STM3625 TaxID=1211777 RepID=K0PV66_9HYPH|nr:hypothetical protein BN77_2517 [Rhizobium mesoamericanum STM3625]
MTLEVQSDRCRMGRADLLTAKLIVERRRARLALGNGLLRVARQVAWFESAYLGRMFTRTDARHLTKLNEQSSPWMKNGRRREGAGDAKDFCDMPCDRGSGSY